MKHKLNTEINIEVPNNKVLKSGGEIMVNLKNNCVTENKDLEKAFMMYMSKSVKDFFALLDGEVIGERRLTKEE